MKIGETNNRHTLCDKLYLSESDENRIEDSLGHEKEWDEPEEFEQTNTWNSRNESTAQEARRCFQEQMEW